MYNDRNRQNYHCARQMPTAVRVASDIPRLDADQGGRRCDGSSPDHTLDHAQRGQVSNGHAGNGGCGRMGNGNGCGNTSRERMGNGNGCGHTGNGRGCGNAENGNRGWGLHDHPLAMVYSPYQHFRDTYTPDIALGRGTLFSELDLPFEGYNNKRNGGCAR